MIRSYDNSGSLISIAGPRLGDPRNGPTNIELVSGFDGIYEVEIVTDTCGSSTIPALFPVYLVPVARW